MKNAVMLLMLERHAVGNSNFLWGEFLSLLLPSHLIQTPSVSDSARGIYIVVNI